MINNMRPLDKGLSILEEGRKTGGPISFDFVISALLGTAGAFL